MPKKAIIFTVKLGGGHMSAAKALQENLVNQGISVRLVNLSDHFVKLGSKDLLQWFYYVTSVRIPILWDIFVWIGTYTPLRFGCKYMITILTYQLIRKHLDEYSPDIAISTYPLALPIAKYQGRQKPHRPPAKPLESVVVVTDPFSAPFYWFLEPTAKYVVFSQEAHDQARRMHIPAKNLRISDHLLHPKYLQPLSEKAIQDFKQIYKLKSELSLLVLAGGEGLPNGRKIVRKLAEGLPQVNILVVCGRDQTLQAQIEQDKQALSWEHVYVYGFVDYVYELMCLAQVVVSKAGPASVLEAVSLGKPLIITDFYPQEKGNLQFVQTHNLGVYAKDPQAVLAAATKYLQTGRAGDNPYKPGIITDPQYLRALLWDQL